MAQQTSTTTAAGSTAVTAGILRTLIPPERQQVLARAILRASRTAGRHKAMLSRALQQDFRLNGASRPTNEERDIKQMTRLTGQADQPLLALARLWFVTQEDLRERLRVALEPYAVESTAADLRVQGFWEQGSADAALQRVQADISDVADDDLLLAWALLTGRALLPPAERPEQLQELALGSDEPFPLHPDERSVPDHFAVPFWAEVIERVSALDDDDPAWAELDDALLALQRLGSTHQSRREARWTPLREALQALQEQPARALADLGITEVASWVAEQCPPAQVADVAAQVTALSEDVAAYAEVQARMQQLARATFAERRDARQQELDLGNRVLGAFDALQPLLHAPDGPRTPTPTPTPTSASSAAPRTPSSTQHAHTADAAVEPADAAADRDAAVQPADADVADDADDAETGATDAQRALPVPARQGLRSVSDAARALTAVAAEDAGEGPEPTRTTDLLWALVADGDVAGAAWIARALERPALEQGLRAVVGAALATPRNRIGQDLASVQEAVVAFGAAAGPDEAASVRLLRLAAALRPSLTVPHSGMRTWLFQDAETHLAGLDAVLDELRRLPVVVPNSGGPADRWAVEQELQSVVAAAARTRRQPPGFNFGGGQPLWRRLTQVSELATVLNSVADDEREARAEVRAAIAQWSDSGWRDAEIQRQHRRCSSGHTSADDPFEGQSLHIMQREIGDLLTLGTQWLQQLDLLDELHQHGGRHAQQSLAQRERLTQLLPQAWGDLCTLQARSQALGTQATARVLAWALQEVASDLRLPLPLGPGRGNFQPQIAAVSERTRRLGSANSLAGALGNRIAQLPGVSLDWHDEPAADVLPQVPLLLAREML